ncbi:MAG: hypothetical protein JWO87_146, partial [Phycisphaerales bacterium]|nr:hypothetical protein [Phycisphaerales bacterium]
TGHFGTSTSSVGERTSPHPNPPPEYRRRGKKERSGQRMVQGRCKRFAAECINFIKFVVKSAFKSVKIGQNRSRNPCRGLEMRVRVARRGMVGHPIVHDRPGHGHFYISGFFKTVYEHGLRHASMLRTRMYQSAPENRGCAGGGGGSCSYSTPVLFEPTAGRFGLRVGVRV